MSENSDGPKKIGRRFPGVRTGEIKRVRNPEEERVRAETIARLDVVAEQVVARYGTDEKALAEYRTINARGNFDRFDDYDMISPYLKDLSPIEKRPGVYLGLAYRWIEQRKKNSIR